MFRRIGVIVGAILAIGIAAVGVANAGTDTVGTIVTHCNTDYTGHQLCAQANVESSIGGFIRADAKVWCQSASGINACSFIQDTNVLLYDGASFVVASASLDCGYPYVGCSAVRYSLSTEYRGGVNSPRARILVCYAATPWQIWGHGGCVGGSAIDFYASGGV